MKKVVITCVVFVWMIPALPVAEVVERAAQVWWAQPSTAQSVQTSGGYVAYVALSDGRPFCWATLRFADHPELHVELPQHVCTDLGMRLQKR